MSTSNKDNKIRKAVNRLDGVPAGLERDPKAGWEKLESRLNRPERRITIPWLLPRLAAAGVFLALTLFAFDYFSDSEAAEKNTGRFAHHVQPADSTQTAATQQPNSGVYAYADSTSASVGFRSVDDRLNRNVVRGGNWGNTADYLASSGGEPYSFDLESDRDYKVVGNSPEYLADEIYYYNIGTSGLTTAEEYRNTGGDLAAEKVAPAYVHTWNGAVAMGSNSNLTTNTSTYTLSVTESHGATSGYVVGDQKNKNVLQEQSQQQPIETFESGTESYSTIVENRFKSPSTAPLSTFSIDVDEASYTNIRRFLKDENRLPPADAVRLEEMVNYFDYTYPQPVHNRPFEVVTELASCPWNAKRQLLHIGIQGKNVQVTDLPASNLVFLLDVSGSMDEPNKLPLVKKSMEQLVERLRPQDRVAIVVYAGAAGCVLNSTPGNLKQEIRSAMNRLEAGGSTAGGEGIELAYTIAKQNFIRGGNNRIILATDGDFNVGISSESELQALIERKRAEGVFLTVLGFGTGNYQDATMEILADKGNGNYAYIDRLEEATKVLGADLAGTLLTIAKDVKLQLEFNPAYVKGYRLIGYENRNLRDEDFANDKIDAGDLGAGHTVTALYEIIPASSAEEVDGVTNLKYQQAQKGLTCDEIVTISLRYKQPDGETSTLLSQTVSSASQPLQYSSNNFRWSAAVASFGMVLRNSEFKGDATYESVLRLAETAKTPDPTGARTEFIELVKKARSISGTVVDR